ncbi:hypothetical protein BDN67DRAFT_363564 [Paxillus ammoniavirescens]|nr:hypothetical protein BDN67DRAFT_363564 [Paxillus ammoniavirescens]
MGDFQHPSVASPREMNNATWDHPYDEWRSQSFENINPYPTFVADNSCDSMTIYQPQPLSYTRHQSAPSTPIAYTAPPNTPNAALDDSAPVLSAAGYYIDPRTYALYNYAPRAHAYHQPSYLDQPNSESVRYPVAMEEPIPRLDTTQGTMLQTAARAPFAASSTFNPQVPHYRHPQAFSNYLGDQGIAGQHGYVTGPAIPKYTPLPPYNPTTAPRDGFAGGTSTSLHPSVAHVAPGHSPTSCTPSNTAHVCQCVGGESPCRTLLTGNMKDLRGHLAYDHHFRTTGKKYHRCLWIGCDKWLQRENIPRHIISSHLRVKVGCETCGVELSRSDVRHSHAKRCPARRSV